MKGRTGASLQTYESAARKKRRARARKREEERWADQAGPVLLTIGGYQIYVKEEGVEAIKKARALLLRAVAGESVDGVSRVVE